MYDVTVGCTSAEWMSSAAARTGTLTEHGGPQPACHSKEHEYIKDKTAVTNRGALRAAIESCMDDARLFDGGDTCSTHC